MSTSTHTHPRPPVTLVRLLLAFALLVVLWPAARPAAAAPDDQLKKFSVTNHTISATGLRGTTLYVGGNFDYVGPETGSFAAFDSDSPASNPAFPRVDGSIYAIAPDGTGGWYLGGAIRSVRGVARSGLAHIRADKTLDPTWKPNVAGEVHALTVQGTTVYVGGEFTSVNGQPRTRLAALNATNGSLTAWSPAFDTRVSALVVSGNRVYVGASNYDYYDRRGELKTLDASTGDVIVGGPGMSEPVQALALSGTTLYVGGRFNSVGKQSRISLAAFNTTTGALTSWNPPPSSYPQVDVRALAVSGNTVYVGGIFGSIAEQFRSNLAALDATSGKATAWNPRANAPVLALAVSGSTVYVGGEFTMIAGQERRRLAALDAATGTLIAGNGNTSAGVFALAASGSKLYAGGEFTSVGGQPRNRLAAFDTTTGQLLPWNPNVNGGVATLHIRNNLIYIAGNFTQVGGQRRLKLAALDLVSGIPTAWSPGIFGSLSGSAFALSANASTVYVAGVNGGVSGEPFVYLLKAINAATGAVIWQWSVETEGEDESVTELVLRGNTLYVAGAFSSMGGQPRNGLAALDATTGTATAWNPNPNGDFVRALAVSRGTVYVGGNFTTIGGQPRNGLAALAAATGATTAWNPGTNGLVELLLVRGSTIFVAGGFSRIGAQARDSLAALDAASGAALDWNPYENTPETNERVWDFTANSSTVYIGASTFRGSEYELDQTYLGAIARPDVPTTARAAPPAATQGADYAYSFTDGDEDAPAWRVTAGSLPDGMMLHADGTLSGTPTTSGTATFTVADANNSDTIQTVTLTVAAPTMTPRVYLPMTAR